MKVALKVVTYLFLAFLPVMVSGFSREEIPHGEPNEELVEKHRGSRARVQH